MPEPDPWRGQLAFHEIAHVRRDDTLFDWEGVLRRYITIVLREEEPLRFRLMTGQPVYSVFTTEVHVVGNTNPPLEAYLEPARVTPFNPFDTLSVMAHTTDTFLIRIDFADQPDFDAAIYNRLRLEHVLRSIRQSSAIHYSRLLLLYQFHRYCQLVLPGYAYRIPPLEDAYAFLEGNPFL